MRGAVLLVASCALLAGPMACSDSTGAGAGLFWPLRPNVVQLHSDAGDPVGAGISYEYTQANAVFDLAVSGLPAVLTFSVTGDQGWAGFFEMPSGTRLERGTFQTSPRWHGPGPGQTCNATGSFTIDRVSYAGTTLEAIDLSFEQLCDGAAGALHGTIHWQAHDPTHAPGPVNPPPSDLWRPANGVTPAGQNYVYLQSDSGDAIGQGQSYLYTPANATIGLIGSFSHLHISVASLETWSGDFLTMNSVPRLAPGYYPELGGFPFMNPTRGGLSWSGQGRLCTVLAGWFTVDHVTYAADTLTALDLRFEQRCIGSPSSALHGAVHWTR